MLSISNRKPDKNIAGRKLVKSATWAATNWFFVIVEIKSPWPSAGTRNEQARSNSASQEPRSGTSSSVTASVAQPAVASNARPKYGSSLPSRISRMPAGVDMIASIVPRSHSRAMTSAVSSVPIIAITMAIAPGTRKRRLSISGLNQKRGSKATGAALVAARAPAQFATTPSA